MFEKEREVVLYGASFTGRMALKYYGKDRVKYFCDGNREKIGTFIDGIEVISKEHLAKIKDDIILVITSSQYKAIIKELNELGIFKYQLYQLKNLLYYPDEYNKLRDSIRSVLPLGAKTDIDTIYRESEICYANKKDGRKIVFALNYTGGWMQIESLYKAAAKSEHCYCVVMNMDNNFNPAHIAEMALLRNIGVEMYDAADYKIEEDQPDVVIYIDDWQSWGGKSIKPENAKKFAKKLVLIPSDMVVYAYNQATTDSEIAKRYLRQNADMCFVNPDFYEKFKYYQKNLIVEGNSKFDYIWKKINGEVNIPYEWKKKIGDKKVIMWATAHGLDHKKIAPIYTFDIWVKDIIDYFKEHREYVLLFRASPRIFQDLIVSGVCTYNECKHFEKMFEYEENFILDVTPDYGLAYRVSDALLCPPNGMLLSYLPTKKPIIYTATYRMDYSFTDKELIKNFYLIRDKKELEKAIDDVFKFGDPLYEKRMQTLEKYIPCFDGKIGERIMSRILETV